MSQLLINAGLADAGDPFDIMFLTAQVTLGTPTGTWSWVQTSGPTVTLFGSGASRHYQAPALATPSILVFRVQIDGAASSVTHNITAHSGLWQYSASVPGLVARGLNRTPNLTS